MSKISKGILLFQKMGQFLGNRILLLLFFFLLLYWGSTLFPSVTLELKDEVTIKAKELVFNVLNIFENTVKHEVSPDGLAKT